MSAVYEFIQSRIARRHNSHLIQTPAMAERGGAPLRRLAVRPLGATRGGTDRRAWTCQAFGVSG
eukprot:3987159-Pleurochrysis_carterae.AAC.1